MNTKIDSADTMVRTALPLHQAGRLAEAEPLYRMALQVNPRHADALHYLGLLEHQRGNNAAAVPLLEKAVVSRPQDANFCHNLGIVQKAAGDPAGAIASFRQALRIQEAFPEAHNNLGVALREQGNHEEALLCFVRAVAWNQNFVEALANVGAELNEAGRYDDALPHLQKALVLRPAYLPALNNLGNALYRLHRLEEAQVQLAQLVALDPENIEGHFNLGIVLRMLGHPDEAEAHYRRVLEKRPGFTAARVNLGVALSVLGRFDEARQCFEQALIESPDSAEAMAGLASMERAHGDNDRAMALFERALPALAGNAELQASYALGLFRAGRLPEAWRHYEVRWQGRESAAAIAQRSFPQAMWNGETLAGKNLLVWGEQGLGDEIWAAGMFPDLLEGPHKAGRVVIECAPKLAPLFRLSFGAAVVVPRKDPPDQACLAGIDVQIAAASLGGFLRPGLESFPGRDRYLMADPDREAFWRRKFSTGGSGLKVGICWRSSMTKWARAHYCTSLAQWKDVFAVSGVRFVNLQYDECQAELLEAGRTFGIAIERYPEVDMLNDLAETAALMRGLDLVISAPTVVPAMSAALGVATWQLNFGEDWQAFGQSSNPWYPAMRTFVRTRSDDWETVLARVGAELAARANSR